MTQATNEASDGPGDRILAKRSFHSTPDPQLRSLSEPIVRWPVTVVLLSGNLGDYAAYVGIGSPEWVGAHGNKLSFQEARGFFPHIDAQRYRE